MSTYIERVNKLKSELWKNEFSFGISQNFRGSFVFNGTNQDDSEFRLLRAHATRNDLGQIVLDALVEIELDNFLGG